MAKKGGFGVQLKITITATLTLIAQLEDTDFPEQEAVTTEVTTHDSTGGYAEFVKNGLFKLSKFTATVIWDKAAASHIGMLAALAATTPVIMTITTTDAEVISFSGFVVKVARDAKQSSALKTKIDIQPTGIPTIT